MNKKSKNKQAARLALFDSPTDYEEKHIGDKWYVKSFNGTTGKWQVAEYSEESFQRYKGYAYRFKQSPINADPWRCCVCNEIIGYGPSQFLPLHKCKTNSKTFAMG